MCQPGRGQQHATVALKFATRLCQIRGAGSAEPGLASGSTDEWEGRSALSSHSAFSPASAGRPGRNGHRKALSVLGVGVITSCRWVLMPCLQWRSSQSRPSWLPVTWARSTSVSCRAAMRASFVPWRR